MRNITKKPRKGQNDLERIIFQTSLFFHRVITGAFLLGSRLHQIDEISLGFPLFQITIDFDCFNINNNNKIINEREVKGIPTQLVQQGQRKVQIEKEGKSLRLKEPRSQPHLTKHNTEPPLKLLPREPDSNPY